MKKEPILAICYDFDKTLSPDDMQAQGYIQSIEYEVADFWKESNKLAADNDMDQNLAYMYMMRDKSRGRVLFTKETLHEDGSKVKLFPSVDTWFDRINEYGKSKGVIVEHYIISSGLKEMIEGTEEWSERSPRHPHRNRRYRSGGADEKGHCETQARDAYRQCV